VSGSAGAAVTEQALELTRKAAAVFEARGFENPRLQAELLLAGVLGMRRLDLYLQHDRPVGPAELELFRAAVRRRLRHEPLQYIQGQAAFRQLELAVDARVLIPRPETEVLVDAVLRWSAARPAGGSVLDVGTGSGAIALSLAVEGRFARVVATDVSAAALEVAAANARRSGLAELVEFRTGSIFGPLAAGERFDVIVSNPPYVAERDRDALAAEVAQYEPAAALFGGADGLEVIAQLVEQAAAHLVPGGLLALEVGLGQSDAVMDRLSVAGSYAAVRVVPDLTGRPRIVLAEAAHELMEQ
jgi:release factor glutamine methyltransferase